MDSYKGLITAGIRCHEVNVDGKRLAGLLKLVLPFRYFNAFVMFNSLIKP